jgi:hypothetical protein
MSNSNYTFWLGRNTAETQKRHSRTSGLNESESKQQQKQKQKHLTANTTFWLGKVSGDMKG